MKRFLVLAVVGVLGVAGGTGVAFGENGGHKPTPKPQATKAQPPAAPGKHTPSKSPPQVKHSAHPAQQPHAQASKSPGHRGAVVKGPKHGLSLIHI